MRFAVAGQGAAGFRAAERLLRSGAEVTLFGHPSASRTWTRPFESGGLFDGGAEWIDADHRRVLQLAAQFDARLIPSTDDGAGYTLIHRDERCSENGLWGDAADDMRRVADAAADACAPLCTLAWRNAGREDLDRRNVAEFIAEHTTSERGRWYANAVFRSDEGEELDRISLLAWLSAYRNYVDRGPCDASAYRVDGGLGALFQRYRASLSEKLHCRSEAVRTIRDDGPGLSVNGLSQRFDGVVLAIPPVAALAVEMEPTSHSHRSAWSAVRTGRMSKLYLEFDRPWWTEIGWNGRLLVDTPLQQVWENAIGPRPALIAYVCGREAQRLAEAQDAALWAHQQLERLWPRPARELRERASIHWSLDSGVRGGFSAFPPGFVLGGAEMLSRPFGRIAFAGEHASSTWLGFVEGALESGEAAAAYLLDRFG